MTVQCIGRDQQATIVRRYVDKDYNQKELAKIFNTSERTINRILNEFGVATAVPRIKGEAYVVLKTLERHGVAIADLDGILSAPVVTLESVEDHLDQLSHEELADLFYRLSIKKIRTEVESQQYAIEQMESSLEDVPF